MKPDEVAEQVIYKFVKKIHEEECEKLKKKTLTKDEIKKLVNDTYKEKEKSLRQRIKSAIKKICNEKDYTDASNEELLEKIFKDPDFNKKKIIQEIEIKQNL